MIYAEKDNKVYVINETEKDYYLKRGFNLVDESGETIEYGKGNEQTIAAELKAENEKLKAENEELRKAIETSEEGTAEAPEEGKNTSKK
jgi:cell division protein FtsB